MNNLPEEWVSDPNMAEVKLSYKTKPESRNNPILCCPGDAYEYLTEIWDQDTIELQEQFVVILLNTAKRVIGWSKISTGGSTATIVNPTNVMQVAVLSNANSIILAHNHPSSHNRPSTADIRLTRRIQQSLREVAITVDDHLILMPDGGYYSFNENGKL